MQDKQQVQLRQHSRPTLVTVHVFRFTIAVETVSLSLCGRVATPTAGPIVTKLGQQALLFTAGGTGGSEVDFEVLLRRRSRYKVALAAYPAAAGGEEEAVLPGCD